MDKTMQLELKRTANNLRISIIEEVYNAKCGHPGGSLSIADIMTYLYFVEMNIDPKNPKMDNRDRFVLSKGHTAPALYAALAERGFFPKEDLVTLRKTASYLQGHPDMKGVPGVDMSTCIEAILLRVPSKLQKLRVLENVGNCREHVVKEV